MVVINISSMVQRVEHGFHLSNEEARWLLAQVGAEVPRKKRCNICNATGQVEVRNNFGHPHPPFIWNEAALSARSSSVFSAPCATCRGSGFLPADPVEYVVEDCDCSETQPISVTVTPVEDETPCIGSVKECLKPGPLDIEKYR